VSRPTRADPAGRAYLDLQNRARREGRPTQALLVMYMLERFLARLAASPYANQFVLKGGMLLAAWDARRPTVDGDFLARRHSNDESSVLDRVVQIARLSRVPWNFGSGPLMSGCGAGLILHGGTDSLCDFAFERCSQGG
jgi:hypothetical protein